MGQITKTLREAIEKSGKPVMEIAKGSGVSNSQLSRFLHGAGLNVDSLEKLAKYFGLKLQ